MERVLRAVDRVSEWVGRTSSWLMLLVVAVVLWEVVMRYVFAAPTEWATETMIMGCGLCYVLGGPWTTKENRHMRMELLYDRLPPRWKLIMDAGTFGFTALYLGFLLWSTAGYAWSSIRIAERSGSSWNPYVFPVKAALLVGVFLVLLQVSARFIRDVRRLFGR